MDPKVKNLIIFLVTRGTFCFCVGNVYHIYTLRVKAQYFDNNRLCFLHAGFAIPHLSGEKDPLRIFAGLVIAIALWRAALSFYRRVLLPPKKPGEYGQWVIVTGSTSGIGKAFIEYLAGECFCLDI